MMELLEFKEKLKALYARFGAFAGPAIKFLLGFLSVVMLNQNLGFMARIDNMPAALFLGIVCMALPYGGMALLAGIVMLAHITAVSLELAAIVLALLLAVLLLYYGFQPGDSYLLVVTPLLFMLKIPYAVPLVVGLAGGIISIIPVSCGIFIYYIISYVKQNAGTLTGESAASEMVQKYTQIVKDMLFNQDMLLMIAAFALCILVVFVVKNLSIDYAWPVAIAAGTVTQLLVFLMGDFMFSVSVDMLQLLLGVLAGCAVEYLAHVNVDGFMGLAVALFILWSGIGIARETISPLLGKRADGALVERISRLVLSHDKVLGLHDLLVHDYGPGQCFASVHVEMSAQEDPLVCHDIIDDIEEDALEQLNVHLVIHYDPVVQDDAERNEMEGELQDILHQVEPRLAMHDFRLVRGAKQTKLVFDLEVPYELMGRRQQFKRAIDQALQQRGRDYTTVIRYDGKG